MAKRPVFQEVSGEATQVKRQTGMIDQGQTHDMRALRLYLAVLFGLVVAMVCVGGLTRLTDSGLSITEWRVVVGVIPPLNEATWQGEFEKYRQICEYQLVNQGMGLEAFKVIYYWEWAHRTLGHLVGLVWAGGFAALALLKRLPTGWAPRITLLGALGGLQAVIGWWMVSSGVFECRVDVSSVRLAIHLGLAFIILMVITQYWLMAGRRARDLAAAQQLGNAKLHRMWTVFAVLVFVQILLGALVAGIDAGRAFTDWPTMGGGILPPEPFALTPFWLNFVENAGLVQFVHRVTGYLIVIKGIVIWRMSRRSANSSIRKSADVAGGLLLVQLVLGILTVASLGALGLGMTSHIVIAVLHQLGAVALIAAVLRARWLARHPLAQSLREA